MRASSAAQSVFDPQRRGWFFVIGVSPGLSAVGYCVLDVDPQGMAHCLDFEVLTGNRAAQLERAGIDIALATAAQLVSRFQIHSKILNVVLERYYPCVIAVGPAALSREPPAFIEAAVTALQSSASLFGLQVKFVDQDQLRDAFPGERLAAAVQSRLSTPIGSRDKRVLRAAAAGLAAAQEVRTESLQRMVANR